VNGLIHDLINLSPRRRSIQSWETRNTSGGPTRVSMKARASIAARERVEHLRLSMPTA
jgi:hypothetical protein